MPREKSPKAPRLNAMMLALAAGILTSAPAVVAAAVRSEPVTIAPVVLTDAGKLAGCGLSADYRTRGHDLTIAVVALRDQTATRFLIEARRANTGQSDSRPVGLALQTETLDSTEAFPPPSPAADGALATSQRLDTVIGAMFIQSVMVGGASVDVEMSGGDKLTLSLPGPMPQLVRASYLNCAGDLFRPEGEGRRAGE